MRKPSELRPDGTLRQALEWINPIAEAADVQIVIDSGTLLGLAREGDLLKGDFDLDVTVLGDSRTSALHAALPERLSHAWRYESLIYKLVVDAALTGPGLPLDIKFFRRVGTTWVCPAIGALSPGGGLGGIGSECRRMLRPLWRKALKHGDAAKWPMRHLTRVDAWVVPDKYFSELRPLRDLSSCFVPADLDAYLSFRYEDWRHPVTDWVSWRDDGAYQSGRG